MKHPRLGRALAILTLSVVLTVQLLAVVPVAVGVPMAPATISGTVTDKDTGSPIVGAFVQPYYETPTMTWIQSAGVSTAADGSYVVTVTPSWPFPRQYTLLFSDPTQAGSLTKAHRRTWWSGVDAQHDSLMPPASQAATLATHFTVNNADALTGYDAQMKHYFVKMSGKVVDRAGTPLAGVSVVPYVKNFASWAAPVNGSANKTDALGRFTIWANPWLEAGCYQTILARDGWVGTKYFDGRWYKNTLQKPPLTLGLPQQSMGLSVKRFYLKSGETTSGLVIRMTRDVADIVTITNVWQTTGRIKHVAGKLTPVHDPALTIRVQYYKYSVTKGKYVTYGLPVVAKASNAGNVTNWSATKYLKSKGRYGARAYVGTHLWKYHRAYKTPLKTFRVY